MIRRIVFRLLMLIITQHSVANPDANSVATQDGYVAAQTANQLAQARYYEMQAKSVNNQFIALISALISGGLALVVMIYNRTGENNRIGKAQKYELIKSRRLAGADLMAKTAEGFHSLTWILWIAKNTPSGFTENLILAHDEKMNAIYAEIAASQVALASHSKLLYLQTSDIVSTLYHYDGDVGRIAIGLKDRNSRQSAIKLLGSMWYEVYHYSLEIPKNFSETLEQHMPLK